MKIKCSRIMFLLLFSGVGITLVFAASLVGRGANMPTCEIISKDMKTYFEGSDRTVYVYATVRNNGVSENVTVYARLSLIGITSGDWSESQTIYLSNGECRKMIFKFQLPPIWPDSRDLRNNPIKPEGKVPMYNIVYDVWAKTS